MNKEHYTLLDKISLHIHTNGLCLKNDEKNFTSVCVILGKKYISQILKVGKEMIYPEDKAWCVLFSSSAEATYTFGDIGALENDLCILKLYVNEN